MRKALLLSIALSVGTLATCLAQNSARPGQGTLTDSNDKTWAVTTQGTVTENGTAAAFTSQVAQVVSVGGTTYQQTTFGQWWGWDGAGWVGVSGDPTQGPVTVTTAADANGQNYALSPSSAVLTNGKLSAAVSLADPANAIALSAAEITALGGDATMPSTSAAHAASTADPCTTPTTSITGQPDPAALAGYNTLTFGPAVVNWIKDTQNGTTANVTANSDGSVTISGGGDTWNGQLETYTGGRGEAFGGGFYAEATASVPGATSCLGSFDNCGSTDSEWPSFWSNSVNGSIEVDFMEMMAPVAGQYGATVHNWSTSPPTVNGQTVSAPAGNTLHGPNTYGFLWIPATASSQGSMSFFFNGNQVGQSITWTQANPGPYGVIDGEKLVLYLGAGPNSPMVVSSVEVWQASTAGDSVNGAPASALTPGAGVATASGGQAACEAAYAAAASTPIAPVPDATTIAAPTDTSTAAAANANAMPSTDTVAGAPPDAQSDLAQAQNLVQQALAAASSVSTTVQQNIAAIEAQLAAIQAHQPQPTATGQ